MAKRTLRELSHLTLRGKRILVTHLEQEGELPTRGQKLKAALASQTKIAVTHHRKYDGATVDQVWSPYSVRVENGRHYLYFTHPKHGATAIHKARMRDVRVRENLTQDAFRPVWPTEPESV